MQCFAAPAPFSGQDAVGLALSGMWRIRPEMEALFRVERNVWEQSRQESEQTEDERMPPFWIFSLGLSWL